MQNHASWRAFLTGFEGLEMLSACFVFHGERRAGSVSDRPLTASAAPGAAPGHHQDARDGLLHRAYVGINTWQPGPSEFQAGSKFLCSGFSAKMAKAAPPHPICASLPSFAAFSSLHSAAFGTGTGLSITPSALWVCKFWPHRSTVMNV